MVPGKGEAVGRHPMFGEGKRSGEIGRPHSASRRRCQPGRHRSCRCQVLAPGSSWCRRRQARSRRRCRAQGDSRGPPHRRPCAQSDRGCRPRQGRRWSCWSRHSPHPIRSSAGRTGAAWRRLEDLGIGERDVVRQRSSRSGAKPSAGLAGAGEAAAAVDERIEHDAEELVHELKRRLLAPVAASPERSVSALARLPPVSPKIFTKAGGSAPPLLKKLLSALATFV